MTNCVFIDYLVRCHNQGMYKKVTYIRMRKFKIQKIKYLFISIKVQLITISGVIPYISETNSTRSSLKKIKREKESANEQGKEKEKEKKEKKKG